MPHGTNEPGNLAGSCILIEISNCIPGGIGHRYSFFVGRGGSAINALPWRIQCLDAGLIGGSTQITDSGVCRSNKRPSGGAMVLGMGGGLTAGRGNDDAGLLSRIARMAATQTRNKT